MFFFNGGLGFLYLFRDWRNSGKGLVEFWSHLSVNYAHMPSEGIVWANVIADGLLPQRTLLFGMPIALMIFTLLILFWRENGGREPVSTWSGWRILLAAGLLTGLLPTFHPHSYGAIGMVSVIVFLLRPRRVWLAFWVPALLLALPHFMPLVSQFTGAGFARFQPGWRGHDERHWLLFWLRNVGLPTLLIIPAWFVAARPLRHFYLAFVALLIFSLLVVVSPNDYDNLKLMYYWYAATCVLVAAWLVRLAATLAWTIAVLFLALASIASGLLAVSSELQTSQLVFNRDEIAAADFVRTSTAPRALFLTAPSLHQPILSLAGRAIVRGPTAWLWSHGYPFAEREADVRAIYAGRDDAFDLLRYYRVDYIYLGPRERDDLKANRDFFDRAFPSVYRGAEISIYDARPGRSNDDPAGRPPWLRGYPPREYAARVDLDPFEPLVEFSEIGYVLYRSHHVLYGRLPRYDEFMADLHEVGRRVYPGAADWRQALETNQRKLTETWIQRADFKQRYGALTAEQYIAALYSNAGIEPSRQERAELSAALASGSETRASLLRRVSAHPQFSARDYNAAFVLLHYFGYLRRDPEPDLVGYKFWLRNLDRSSDFRSVTRAFLESEEYKGRKP